VLPLVCLGRHRPCSPPITHHHIPYLANGALSEPGVLPQAFASPRSAPGLDHCVRGGQLRNGVSGVTERDWAMNGLCVLIGFPRVQRTDHMFYLGAWVALVAE
jgi:hypothetical protein